MHITLGVMVKVPLTVEAGVSSLPSGNLGHYYGLDPVQ